MTERTIKRMEVKLTDEQKGRHDEIRKLVDRDRPRLTREALSKKAELTAMRDAMVLLKRQREARGLALGEVARRSGIDKSRLSKLENDPRSNPTMATLTRLADAIGVKLSIHVEAA
ncbi:MAG: helix-turn-helix domain-containing protein [Phycisphaerae bacterium]